MKVKVSERGSLFWDDGRLVWDDPVGQRQLALTPESEGLLRAFATWQELDTVADVDARLAPIAARLVEEGVLIEEGSAAHADEEKALARWRPWGAAARQYHFASRTPQSAAFVTAADDAVQMQDKARRQPPPPIFKAYPESRLVPVREGAPDDSGWAHPGLLDALYRRRSTREFSPEAVALEELAGVVEVAAGIVELRDDPIAGPTVFKTSPSAGARDPIEVYAIVRNVDGLTPGVYHFSPGRGGLEELAPLPGRDVQLTALGGREGLADAPVLLVFTAVIARNQWRYDTARGYRDVLIGLGHVSQTILLTATAMGLGGVFATAVSDERLEEMLGLDDGGEIVLGVTAVGRKPSTSSPS
jgi:SagB-type dehydrogenase family enzyme